MKVKSILGFALALALSGFGAASLTTITHPASGAGKPPMYITPQVVEQSLKHDGLISGDKAHTKIPALHVACTGEGTQPTPNHYHLLRCAVRTKTGTDWFLIDVRAYDHGGWQYTGSLVK